jgi:hypothetical protein
MKLNRSAIMFKTAAIPTLIKLFEDRKVHLYHSCQYQDFCSYLKLGGIPSRKALEDAQFPITAFTTDGNDRRNGVWDKVFLNLDDFGKIFATGRNGVPNVYGPILFRFQPHVLFGAIDVAVCLRSAGAEDFDREKESLKRLEDVNSLFFYSSSHPDTLAALKCRQELQKTFGKDAQSVEISCTFPNNIMHFQGLIDIVIDPYFINNAELSQYVLSQMRKDGYDFKIGKRSLKISPSLYQFFLTENKQLPRPTVLAKSSNSASFCKWAEKIEGTGRLLLKNYYRFLQYLQTGTYLPLKSQTSATKISNLDDHEIPILDDLDDFELFENEFFESGINDPCEEEENDLILEELGDDQANWARSSDDGWFYSDDSDE